MVAQAATLALLHALFSQWFSFFVSTLEALNFQPVGLANPSAELLLHKARGLVFGNALELFTEAGGDIATNVSQVVLHTLTFHVVRLD